MSGHGVVVAGAWCMGQELPACRPAGLHLSAMGLRLRQQACPMCAAQYAWLRLAGGDL